MPDPSPQPKPGHCRYCHQDVPDAAQHFRTHHAAAGGFPSTCNEWLCPAAARRKNNPQP